MMLNSLEITNFKNLQNLRIESLARVNLFTGKNNTGKSTILEAIAIFAAKGDINLIYQLLDERGENFRQTADTSKSITEINVRALSSLFAGRKIGFKQKDNLWIGTLEETLFGEELSTKRFVSLRFVKYEDELISADDTGTVRRKRTIINDEVDAVADYNVGIEIRSGIGTQVIPLERERPYRLLPRFGNNDNCQFIRTNNIDRDINGKLWDNITLTEKESYVIDALRIIEPDVERIAFIEEQRERTAVIKLKNNVSVLPIKGMGDGINRILTMILAIVNCDKGFLLLDEFENGLHYSVQEKLWKIIFEVSRKLDIQVFATTHSEDCIHGFERAINSGENSSDGKLIRLDIVDGFVKQVEFSLKELKIANDLSIETR